MSIFCITGARPAAQESFTNALIAAGMAGDQALQRDPNITLAVWHRRVLAALKGNESAVPSRLWEQLAADLLLANIDAPIWGWNEPDSMALLDFWAEFEPSIRFVLVCETPRQALEQRFTETDEPVDFETTLADWHATHQTLLHFHLRHLDRSVLVWANEVEQSPGNIVANLSERWDVPFKLIEKGNPGIREAVPLLARHLANEIAQTYPFVHELARELCATVVSTREDFLGGELVATAEDLVLSFRQLADRSAEQEKLAQLNAEINGLQTIVEQLTANNRRLVEENTALGLAHHEISREKEEQENQLKEAREESELILQQLHQVQEELENYFLRISEVEKQLQASQQEIANTHTQLQTEKKARDEAQNKAVTLAKEKSELTAARDSQAQLATERQSALESLTAQCDAEAKAKAEALAARDALSKEKSDLIAARDKLSKERADLLANREALGKEKTGYDSKLKDAEEENELILQQLHQVQEELENYFLKHQEAQYQIQKQQQRWERLLGNTPGLYDCEQISIDNPGKGDLLSWKLADFSAGGRTFKSLAFKTVIEQGVAGFIFQRSDDQTGPLLRWPVNARKDQEITVIPLKDEAEPRLRAANLVQLASSDWEMIQVLPNVLTTAIQSGRVKLTDGAMRKSFVGALARTKRLMASLNGLIRFDVASLLGQNQTETREVLAIQLENIEYLGRRLPKFDFQIQASVNASSFGGDVHLIFPEGCAAAPIENWFSNVSDSGGKPVLALRLDTHGVDAAVWEKLCETDRAFIVALVDSLPIVLVTLQANGTRLPRAWQAWNGLSSNARNWVRIHSANAKSTSRKLEAQGSVPSDATEEPVGQPDAGTNLPTQAAPRPARKGRKPKEGGANQQKPMLPASKAKPAKRTALSKVVAESAKPKPEPDPIQAERKAGRARKTQGVISEPA